VNFFAILVNSFVFILTIMYELLMKYTGSASGCTLNKKDAKRAVQAPP
jgi:hypothetical protein